jgi:hypothetical protein
MRPPPSLTLPRKGGGNAVATRVDSNFNSSTQDALTHPATQMRPRSCFIVPPEKGVGNAGCPLHPQPRVGK